jgi:hypothetical protein
MANRIALIGATFITIAILTVGLVAAGFIPIARDASGAAAAASMDQRAGPVSGGQDARAGRGPKVETVYVEAQPTPRVVRVRERTSARQMRETRSGARTSGSHDRGRDGDDDRFEDHDEEGHEDHEERGEHEDDDR